ncbi:sensor histidine kinase [Clostridium tagluense]|uniref:sensor histidine kinase n=1 Tax=Clostridium tagluense TaxID=360422 RepID=UPI001CF3DF5E|nr:GHKL domain-containing protein [Clostridium tagluense]MCB2299565.1 GHKL domain-containing protein [Clostridium tagluense]
MSTYLFFVSRQMHNSIITALLVNFIFGVSDAISGTIILKVFEVNYSILRENFNLHINTHILVFIVSFFISKCIGIFFIKTPMKPFFIKFHLTNKTFAVIYIGISLFILYIYVQLGKKINFNGNKIFTLNIIIFILYFMLSLLVFYLNHKSIRNHLELEFKEKELAQLKEYTFMIEELACDLRKFKHDYNNILFSIKDFIEKEDLPGFKRYFTEQLLPESNAILKTDMNLSILQKIQIDGLKGLISSKILSAQHLEIKVTIEISQKISIVSIHTLDLCRILGIFFDNAIEGTLLCKKSKIEFAIIIENNCTLFLVSNTCSLDVPPIYKIYEKGFSTKGSNRGFGLNIVKTITDEKYSNIMLNTKIGSGVFVQELAIYS